MARMRFRIAAGTSIIAVRSNAPVGCHGCHAVQLRVSRAVQQIRHGVAFVKVAAGAAYEKLLALRGRVKFSVDLRRLREDRA